MKRKSILKRLMWVLVNSASILGITMIQPATALIVINDQFDDGVLNPAWSINFQNSTGWTFSESGTNLTVTDIAPVVVNSESGGTWASVILSRSFRPLTDFHAQFNFSWDSGGTYQAMQVLTISLCDRNNNLVSAVSYYDAWIYGNGVRSVQLGSNSYVLGGLNEAGTASGDISRLGSNTTISWDGSTLVSGVASEPITKVLIDFMYYPYVGNMGISYFGTESVDFIKIEGTPVPEPGILILLGISMASVIGLRRWWKE